MIAPIATETCWHVLHTKSRQEKAVADYLARRGIEHFLPLLPQVRYYGKRKAKVALPLFPGYVFLRGTREEAFEADRTRRLAQIIEVADQEQFDRELGSIRLALEAEAPLEPFPYLRKGIRAEVRSGPMRGMQGVVQDRTQRDRLILQVETLGQAVSVEVDGSLLDPVE
ncbi:MAG: transcription termination/antitermination NusG family protein [Phycisphaeraceae bacterium]